MLFVRERAAGVGLGQATTGVVDEDVNGRGAEVFLHCGASGAGGEVHGDGVHPGPVVAAEIGCGLVQSLCATGDKNEIVTVSSETPGESQADSRGAAGDESSSHETGFLPPRWPRTCRMERFRKIMALPVVMTAPQPGWAADGQPGASMSVQVSPGATVTARSVRTTRIGDSSESGTLMRSCPLCTRTPTPQ